MAETIIAALVAAAVSLVVSLLAIRQARRQQTASAYSDISDRYDKLVSYRAEHPEVLALSRSWTPACMPLVYRQASDEDRGWAVYYGYIELCIGYSNAVLYARRSGRLDGRAFDLQHKHLIKLLIAEHWPILSALSAEGKYVSPMIGEFIREIVKDGDGAWSWEEEHAAVTSVSGGDGPERA